MTRCCCSCSCSCSSCCCCCCCILQIEIDGQELGHIPTVLYIPILFERFAIENHHVFYPGNMDEEKHRPTPNLRELCSITGGHISQFSERSLSSSWGMFQNHRYVFVFLFFVFLFLLHWLMNLSFTIFLHCCFRNHQLFICCSTCGQNIPEANQP